MYTDEQVAAWHDWYNDPEPHLKPLPGRWGQAAQFQRMLILRCLRPDKITNAVSDFITAQMGKKFIEPPPLDLNAAYADSSPAMPLIFILSPGADPMVQLLSFAERRGMENKTGMK